MRHPFITVVRAMGEFALLIVLTTCVTLAQEDRLPAQAQREAPLSPSFAGQVAASRPDFTFRTPFYWGSSDTSKSGMAGPGGTLPANEPPKDSPTTVTEADEGNSCDPPNDNDPTADERLYTDCRGVFDATFYIGLAIDTFAGDDTLSLLYRNPGATGPKERAVGGFDFAYRLFGDKTPMVREANDSHRSLWVYGETVHGVRSADINCNKNPDLPVCLKSLPPGADQATQIYYILRNATSLEGFMGLRYEFKELERDSASPARLYLKAQAGFLSIAGASGGTYALHHLALGAIATKGRFQGSYLEAGWGRSDTFATLQHRRVKVDGYLQWTPKVTKSAGLSAFTQLFVDTSLGRRGNAIQTYVGINYDLDRFLGALGKK
jgi:hypothetical protein